MACWLYAFLMFMVGGVAGVFVMALAVIAKDD